MAGERFLNVDTLRKYAFAARIDNLKQAAKGSNVNDGCEVTANAPADMDVDIAAGVILLDGAYISVGAVSDQTISTADSTNPRWDILSVDDTGTVNYAAGTPDANPYPPDLPDGEILLAAIFVGASVTQINQSDILDARMLETFGVGNQQLTAVNGTDSSSTTETEQDSFTLEAKYLDPADIVMIVLRGSANVGTGVTVLKLRIAGTNTFTTADLRGAAGGSSHAIYRMYRDPDNSNFFRLWGIKDNNGTITMADEPANLGAPIGSENITFSLRGTKGTESGTFTWRWAIYLMRGGDVNGLP